MRIVLSALILSVVLVYPAAADSARSRACLTVDVLDAVPRKDEKPRLDAYAIRIKSLRRISAFVIIDCGGASRGRARSTAVQILDYLVNKRHVKPEEIQAVIVERADLQGLNVTLMICPDDLRDSFTLFGQAEVIKGKAIKKGRLRN